MDKPKKIEALQHGLKVLQPRIKKLRDQSYPLEKAYARMFCTKRDLEEQVTPKRIIPTPQPGTRTRQTSPQISVTDLVARLSDEEKAKLIRQLGG